MATEKVVLQVDTQRNTCCHAGGSMTFDSNGNLYLATGDNTNPFESSAFTPIDERAGRQDYDAQRSAGNTNDLRGKVIRIHPEDDGTYTVPAGNLFAPGTAKTRPEIFAMGFRNPFRIGVDQKTDTLYVADYGPGRRRANPNRGPEGRSSGTSSPPPATTAGRTASGNNKAYNDYNFPSGPIGREVRLRRAGERLAEQHRPDQPAAGHRGDRGLRLQRATRASPRSAAAAPRWAARSTATTPTPRPSRKWPAYYDGKALFGEWNQSKMYTMQVSADGKSLIDINQLLTGMSMVRPMDFEFGPDGALYLIEWGTGFGGNNADSGRLPDRLHRR